MLNRLKMALLAAMASVIAISYAEARELRATSHVSPQTDSMKAGYGAFVEQLAARTGGAYTVKVFGGGALFGADTALQGISDGVADLGYVSPHHGPAQFPRVGVLFNDLGFVGRHPAPVAAAANELLMLECPGCLKEFAGQGVVCTGLSTAPGMSIMTREPVHELKDIAGMKIRSPGSLWEKYLASMGATPVALSSAEQYEAISRGVVDGTMHILSSLDNLSLADVTPHVLLVDSGIFRSNCLFAFNRDVWSGMDEATRRIVLELGLNAGVDVPMAQIAGGERATENARAKGVEFNQPSPSIEAHLAEFAGGQTKAAVEAAKGRGVEEAAEIAAAMERLTAKWQAVWAETGGDVEAFKARMREDIISRIDLTKHGL